MSFQIRASKSTGIHGCWCILWLGPMNLEAGNHMNLHHRTPFLIVQLKF